MKNGSWLQILERLGGESRIHYSLDHFTQALECTGSPEKSVKTIVIAGTNGKGTTSLLVSAALREAGLHIGTYLSPHLESPLERFLENGRPATLAELEKLALQNESLAEKFQLTYFEFLTLLCFLWAREKAFDYLVLEVGMGGRLDATNVTLPVATAITTIDWDHQNFLGNTLESILNEKMGILRPGVPVFTSIRENNLRALLEDRCLNLGIKPTYGWTTAASVEEVSWEGQKVLFEGHPFLLRNPTPGFFENSKLAYRLVRNTFPDISISTLQVAFSKTLNPGRMEVIRQSPRVVLSGDHNPAGIDCLIETLGLLQTRPKILCAFSPDKPHALMIEKLRSVANEVLLTEVPRFHGKMPNGYQALAQFNNDPVQAFLEMLHRCDSSDTLVVTGSLYLVGEIKSALRKLAGNQS